MSNYTTDTGSQNCASFLDAINTGLDTTQTTDTNTNQDDNNNQDDREDN